jgi:hypothetical protein
MNIKITAFGMKHRTVLYKVTKVSEQLYASFFRVEHGEGADLSDMLVRNFSTGNRALHRRSDNTVFQSRKI